MWLWQGWVMVLVGFGHEHSPVSCSYRCHVYPYPDTTEERQAVVEGLNVRIQDLETVSKEHISSCTVGNHLMNHNVKCNF